MITKRAWREGVTLVTLLLLSGGCASTGRYCSPEDPARGYVCYDGIRFAKNADPLYRRGVRDGCETGKGYFTKNYRFSGSSESYLQGWADGRRACRPAGWRDEDPTRRSSGGDASLHPGREADRTASSSPIGEETLPPRLRRTERVDESPEVLSYD